MKKEYFENILKRLEIKFEAVEVVKNNNTIMKGYTLGETNLRPTIYMDMIESFDDEVEVVKFLEGLNMKTKNVDEIFIKERFENKVLIGVRNKEWNTEDTHTVTFDIPDFEDLEGYYMLQLTKEDCIALGIIHTEEDGQTTTKVTDGMMEAMNLDENWLRTNAEKTMLENITIKGMCDTLVELMSEGETIPFLEDDIEWYREHESMYVLSVKSKIHGAGILGSFLCRDKIKDFIEKMNISKYAILPSSIHEVLLVKLDEAESDKEMLDNMVKEVNEEQVDVRERLSNHSYIFTL